MPPPAGTHQHGRIYRSCRTAAVASIVGYALGLVAVAGVLMFHPDLDKSAWCG